jgi:hypothetical protein
MTISVDQKGPFRPHLSSKYKEKRIQLDNILWIRLISRRERKPMMSGSNDILKDPLLYIEEIEHQLDDVIHKKKEDIEKNLEIRIQKEKSEAQQKIEQIEKEFGGKKEALVNYRTSFSEYENNKTNIQSQRTRHLEKAIELVKELEKLTAQSLEELKKVSELDQKLQELTQTAKEKAETFKKDLEEGFEIEFERPEHEELEETKGPEEIKEPEVIKDQEEIDLAKEREKLKQIVELLRTKEPSKSKKSLSKKYRKSKK